MATAAKKRANEPEPRPIIVKKIIVEGHGGHHGGAWKVAYADFVTAMMAFFLLMWLLGATTEKQRKGLADYFTPTLVEMKMSSAGASGLFGGDSMVAKENYPTTGGQGNLAITIPRDASGTKDVGGEDMRNRDRQKFEALKAKIEQKMAADKALRKLRKNIKFTETREGLRIDLVDEADFAMFGLATDALLPQARTLLTEVAKVLGDVSNDIIVRGHTDGLPYSAGRSMNNWMLSSARADATRAELVRNGVANKRFARIDGVADREPFIPGDIYDPRNRRMSIILAWTGKGAPSVGSDRVETDPEIRAKIAARDEPSNVMRRQAVAADLGGTALPDGAKISNADSITTRSGKTPPGRTDAMPGR